MRHLLRSTAITGGSAAKRSSPKDPQSLVALVVRIFIYWGVLQIPLTIVSMLSPKLKQEREDWESEPLLPSYIDDAREIGPIHLPVKSHRRVVRWRRVIKLGGLLAFAAVLLTMTFVVIPHHFWSTFKGFGPAEPRDHIVPWRKDVTCKDHAQWWDSEVVEYNRRWSSFTNLTVPLNKDGLLLLVEGAISGSVDFVEDDTLVNEAYVDFYVEFHYKTFRKTEFCTLENKHDGTTGVGIFGPKHPEKGKEIKTRITVYLPKSATPKLEKMFVVVPQMEVNFPPDFKIKPKLLAVESRKVLAHVPTVECEYCEFKVSDGPISGNFTVKNELILKTQSGAIDASITMISNTTGPHGGPIVDITTATGPINANFTLVAVEAETEEEVPSGGAYKIATRSRHAPVRLEVVDAPVDSALTLWSKNTRGPLDVYLHPTYQGKFTSEVLFGDPHLGIRGGAEDPSGNGRRRNLAWDGWSIPPGVRRVISGEVWWGDRPGPPFPDYPYGLIFSSVHLKSIVGDPRVSLHVTNTTSASAN